MGNVLVTGGAGYIGSHVARQLSEAGEHVTVLDDLSNGREDAVINSTLVVGNTCDQNLVERVIKDEKIDSILHFAAFTVVPESVSDPLKYYGNNTSNTRSLFEVAVDQKVNHVIFSSTAAVYGDLEDGRAVETNPTNPINPYGWSKLMSEQMLRDLDHANLLKHVILRYFNVAGCDPQGRMGQSSKEATHLIKVACQAALGIRESIAVFGTDFDTPDGTGIRDYIHVEDLASAHVKALEYLRSGGDSTVLNCGYGHGYSVREVLEMVKKVHGADFNIVEKGRRAGDPGMITSVADKVRQTLGWEPQYDDLEKIVSSALQWEQILRDKENS